MPDVKRIELPDRTTVDQQLHAAAVDLLPSEMAVDPLVRWVSDYDGLTHDFNWQEQFSWRAEEEWHGKRWRTLLFCYLASSTLQTKLPFYFGSLFHIGRVRQVSQGVLAIVAGNDRSRVLREWASSLAGGMTGPEREQRAVVALRKLSDASIEYHSRQLAKAEHWWKAWRLEVEPLRRSVEALEKAWGQDQYDEGRGAVAQAFFRLWAVANSPSELQVSMSHEGVRFKPVPPTPSTGGGETLGGPAWVVLLLLAGTGDPARDPMWFGNELRYLLHDWLQAERERRFAPQIQIALDRLSARYGDRNPFDEFGVGRGAATLSLRELAKVNNLPNGQPSPWLHEWGETLEVMPSISCPLPKPSAGDESLGSALRLADSAIKKCVVDEQFVPTETWNEFVQRVFEEKWVEDVGEMAGAMNKTAGQTAAAWTPDEFVDFVERVIALLNKIGYSLRTPAKVRLQTLLDKTSRGEGVRGENSW